MQRGANSRFFCLWVKQLSDQQLLWEARVCFLTLICGFSCKMEELTATKEKPPRKGIMPSAWVFLENTTCSIHFVVVVDFYALLLQTFHMKSLLSLGF